MKNLAWAALFICVAAAQGAEIETNKPKAYVPELLRILPKSAPWEEWVEENQASAPNLDALPSVPYLPDPLKFANGKDVKKEDWGKRKQELLKQFEEYVIGRYPPPPGNVRPANIQSREENGALIDNVVLEFGPNRKAKLRMELIIPKGRGPFPVFITQDNHRGWALIAVSRGYIGCVYAGADSRDDTADWPEIWPDYDWTKLTRRAWAASRCIDYLYGLPVVDRARIALTGHSRNGKTSIIGAAIDPRITAIISSSSGAGGACSYRLFSETQFGEGIELITRNFPDWLHPKLRFFVGRENKLPIDQPELIACIAPRPCLISSALNDHVESIWAIEQTYQSARRVYDLLERGGNLYLRYRPGGHETRAEDIESFMDWLDTVFGRGMFPFPEAAIYPTYAAWQKLSGEKIDPTTFPTNELHDILAGADGATIATLEQWNQKRGKVREQMTWGLGEPPPNAQGVPGSYGSEVKHVAELLGRANVPIGLQKMELNFGNYLAGDIYFPTNADKSGKKIPGVVWLHPISNSGGYAAGYKRGEAVHTALARLGFAVMAFDQIGNAARLTEVKQFYMRYPNWSMLGKDVVDALAAVEALQKLPFIDSTKIYLVGYGTGAMTALHAAALSERITGVIAVAGFTPMRSDTVDKGTGGLARWSVWMPLEPRLGAFIGNENRVPYDYHEVLGMIAPRPVMIYTPKIDYQATAADLKDCVEEAGKIYGLYGARPNLQLYELDDYNRFSPESQKVVFQRLQSIAGLK